MSQSTLPGGLRARLKFVKLIVRDLATAQDFYSRAFGLVTMNHIQLPDIEEAVMGRGEGDPDASLVLYWNKDGRTLAGGDLHGPIGFYVSDVDAVYTHALSQGAVSVRDPFTVGASRVAFLSDPDGHEIEILKSVS
jgi:predicted enzyme related to lactoylglutathione lyase